MSEPVHISSVMRDIMEQFKPNRSFKKKYDRLFMKKPTAANTWLLLQELKDEKGHIVTSEQEIVKLLSIRFPGGLDVYAFGVHANE